MNFIKTVILDTANELSYLIRVNRYTTVTNCEFGNFVSRPVAAILKRIAGTYKLTERERERETPAQNPIIIIIIDL